MNDFGWDQEEEGLALLEVLMNAPLTVCEMDPDHGYVIVTEAGSGPGFTGATISWWTMSCGCTDSDHSRDNLEAAR
jgi:hypothetical protein